MNNDRWIELNTETFERLDIEVIDSKNWRQVLCRRCGHTFGVTPRNDGRVLESQLLCRECQEKENPF